MTRATFDLVEVLCERIGIVARWGYSRTGSRRRSATRSTGGPRRVCANNGYTQVIDLLSCRICQHKTRVIQRRSRGMSRQRMTRRTRQWRVTEGRTEQVISGSPGCLILSLLEISCQRTFRGLTNGGIERGIDAAVEKKLVKGYP